MFRHFASAVISLAVATVLPLQSPASAATTYDMVKDFSIKTNPNGVWAYWTDADQSPLNDARRNCKGAKGLECWFDDTALPGDRSMIGINKSGQTIILNGGNFVFPPGYIMIDPEYYADAYVLFTAPVAGNYTFKGRFIPLTSKEAHKNYAYIFENGIGGQVLWQAKIDSRGPKRFSLKASLKQGDTLLFLQRRDAGKVPNYVGVTAKITGP